MENLETNFTDADIVRPSSDRHAVAKEYQARFQDGINSMQKIILRIAIGRKSPE